MTAQLSQGVAWINQWGWFGWWCAFLVGVLLSSLAIAGIARTKLWLAQAVAVAKWNQQVDTINPLDKEFIGKRINIMDLLNPVTKIIEGKRFINCELFGPANIYFRNDVRLESGLLNCDLVAIRLGQWVFNCIVIENCEFIGGSVFSCALFLPPNLVDKMRNIKGIRFATLTGDAEIDARPIEKPQ
ncbi:hypothetical protein QCD71_12925 [Sphingomonas sp. PsM26]|nr:hypothetical protein [Sphingomonas sp. PsM26]